MLPLCLEILPSSIIFMGVGKSDFREGQVEKWVKTGKLPNLPGFEG